MKKFTTETTLMEVAQQLEADEAAGIPQVSQFKFALAKKVFEPLDFGQSLKEAGLAPSAILIVS